MKRFESMNKSTELDTFVNRQSECVCVFKNKPGTSILNSLEEGDVLLRSVV